MQIYKFELNGCTISIGNDQVLGRIPPEPECWKTKVDEYTWSFGDEDMGKALQLVIDDVLGEPCRVHGRQWVKASALRS